MKKTFNLLLIAIIGSLLLFNSCKKSSSTFSVMPENTQAVLVMDMRSVFTKADLKNIGDYSFFNTAMNELKNENKKVSEIFEDFVDDPKVSGINLLGDLFVYYIDESDDEQFVVFAIPLQKSDKFAGWLEEILEASDTDYDIEKNKSYKYILFEDESGIAWNKDVAIILSPTNFDSYDNIEDEMENLMTLEKDKQISKNKAFVDFYSNKKDFSLWVDYELLSKLDDYESTMDMMNVDLDDVDVSIYLEFLDGEILFSTVVNMPNENDMMKINDADFNKDILEYASNNSLVMMSYAFNTEALAEYLKTIPTIDDADDEIENQIGYSFDEIINTFGGSILVNLADFDNTEVEYTDYEMVWNENTGSYDYEEITATKNQLLPLGVIVFDITSTDLFDDLLDMVSGLGMIKEHGDYFSYENDGMTYYFGYNSEVFVFALDQDAMEQFADGGYSNSLASSDEGKAAKSNSFYMKVNLNLDDYPSSVVDKIIDEDTQAEEIAGFWNTTFDYVEFKSEGDYKSQFSIFLKNDDENSLTFLLHTIDDIYKKFL